MRAVAVAVFCFTCCFSQQAPSNLDFEQGADGQPPPGWFLPKALQNLGYRAVLTRQGCRTGACALLTAPPNPPAGSFGNLMAQFEACAVAGKPVVLRATVRLDAAERNAYAALWLRVDRANGVPGFFDNMQNRPIRAGEWAAYEIRGAIHPDARMINYGVTLHGSGRVLIDDVTLEFGEPDAAASNDAAARAGFAKLYAEIDSAYSRGDVDFLISLADPTAVFGSPFRKIPLDQAIPQLKESLKDARVAVETEILSAAAEGETAKVRTRARLTLTKDGSTTVRVNTNVDTWIRAGNTWRLKEALAVSTAESVPPTSPEAARAVAAEIAKRAAPLKTTEPLDPLDDLEPIGKAIGDARVVALGEATHGTREIARLRHRLLDYLVRKKGFTVLAVEGNWPESEAVDRYIKTGQGNAAGALGELYFWMWQSEEVVALVEWMRAFNKAPGSHPVLSFSSFDMQTHEVALERLIAYVRTHAPRDLATVEASFALLRRLPSSSAKDPRFEEAAANANAVVKLLEQRREALIQASGPAAFRDAVQMTRVVAQWAAMRTPAATISHRDQMMARNVEWLAREAFPDRKIVILAHNGHVSTEHTPSYRPMGSWLRESLGDKLYVLGFAIHMGSVRAVTMEKSRNIGLAESTIPCAPGGTGTAVLSAAGMPQFFLDLRQPGDLLGKWLATPHLFRSCGATWNRDDTESSLWQQTPGRAFDGLIYLENTNAARGF